MAPVVLSMDVHCDSCAKKIRKAVMKVPGAESVTASFETGLVVVEGPADATALRARLQAMTKKDVKVVSDGAEENGEAAGAGAGSASAYTYPATPILLEMELHCRSCADRVERRVMEIPGVDAVTTDVPARRVKVTGTADASVVATSLEVRMRKPVRVVSDPQRPDVVPGYDHEWRKAAAARAAAQEMQEMYGAATTHVVPQEASVMDDASCSLSSLLLSAPPPGCRLRACQPAPSPPAPSSSYGAPPPQAGYWYPEPPGGVYGGQHWAAPAPAPLSGGFYMHRGELFGQQWPAYPPPAPEPEDYYPYGGQQDLNPGSCSIQ
ncbi:heavy metal-associated isoprenylated plant protein 9 [Setaria italica]|uniref:heavy metal-associated isoprenylated plant protein 9 n=1 Tax=Setaria italica TaxID=4555 RepID=UPI0003510BEA|nr:heavy metal-associated isoprenylated plant protein 9 [Setaria italica]XP_034570650.1 heavy metal-associated isoprenylated plant protein 9-like [Setaria viridis]